MNYRHSYHAGNFADVVKHLIVTLIVTYLQKKDAGFFFLDTHAGTGRYDLAAEASHKTGEWKRGIERFDAARRDAPPDVGALIAPYARIIEHFNPDGKLTAYPGSPRLVHAMRRRQDRLSLIEKHPEDAATLAADFAGASGVKVHALDGWMALKSQLPPRERRGLILIDPPFEDNNEFQAIADGVYQAHKRFATGIYCLWYPVKNRAVLPSFHRALNSIGFNEGIIAELHVRKPGRHTETFDGSGMVILNPPYDLKENLNILLPWLQSVLEDKPGTGAWTVQQLR